MASSALRRSLPRRALLRSALPFKLPPAASEFYRSYQSGDGETGETTEEFTERLFGSKGADEGSLYRTLDRVENTSKRYGMGSGSMGSFGDRSSSGFMGGFGDRNSTGSIGGFGNRSSTGSWGGLDSLNDGMTEVLGDAARNFSMDDDDDGEEWDEDFDFRSDVDFRRGGQYNVRDLDLKRPAAAKNPPRPQFETTTAEAPPPPLFAARRRPGRGLAPPPRRPLVLRLRLPFAVVPSSASPSSSPWPTSSSPSPPPPVLIVAASPSSSPSPSSPPPPPPRTGESRMADFFSTRSDASEGIVGESIVDARASDN